MKKSAFFAILMTCSLALSAQQSLKTTLFNLSAVSGTATRSIPMKGDENGFMQVVFTSASCDSMLMRVGYGLTDSIASYPTTITGLSQPILLDKAAPDPRDTSRYLFTHTIAGKTSSAFAIFVPQWRPSYVIFTIEKACLSGKVELLHRR